MFLKICRFIGLALFLSSGTLLAQDKDTTSNDESLIQNQQAKPGFLSLLDDDESEASEALASKRAIDSTRADSAVKKANEVKSPVKKSLAQTLEVPTISYKTFVMNEERRKLENRFSAYINERY
ncbi:MAG: hypothetical protein NWR91_04700, partial [Schleiferiaceae bacterium]|nr:hypothetical protein [Schleiferiaceae bacterium]